MTYLAVPIRVENPEQSQAAVDQAVSAGAEMLELRLDYLNKPSTDTVDMVVGYARQTGLPIIAACRPRWEGGSFKGSEQERQDLLKHALMAGTQFLDIEWACLEQPGFDLNKITESSPAKIIISSHDFKKTPADLRERLASIKKNNPSVCKIAYMAVDINDTLVALDLIYEESALEQQIIALAMGEAGVISRLLAKKLGAFLSFASLKDSAESAPGQLTIEQMKNVYRWEDINNETSVFGVIGYPIAHSISPGVHNAAFKYINYNGLYVPLLVDPPWNIFRQCLDALRRRQWLDFHGTSITIPHKQNARDYVLENQGYLEPLADKLCAVNTLLFDAKEGVRGYNTDYTGALDAITSTLSIERSDLKGIPAAVIGAGGAARAIVGGLTDIGVNVTIYNRTVEKAQRLAEEFNCQFAPLKNIRRLEAKLVVNATSIGMHPNIDALVLDSDLIRPDMVVFDMVYNPLKTMLLQQAEAVGAKTINGVIMFVNQAAAQFELFTGQRAPRDLMRQVIRQQLEKG
ncbi:MAG: hypothetical protein AMJ79_00400 [Phycisphaerae bacterium SM23_30]|nr:MAG: hypothetical protein AMJ79_00400 [Phycisphaerae bacterium SM23_30]